MQKEMSVCLIGHINRNNEHSMYKMSYVQAYTIVYMQAKQKPLHRKDRKLAGVLNMSAPFSLSSRRAAKRTLNGKKWIKEHCIKTVHALKKSSWVWASSSRIIGIKCAARCTRHWWCQGRRSSCLWPWFLSQNPECSDGGGLCAQD